MFVLHVHRSERADRLVEALADLLREPPADPLAVEVVAVPAKGVERWVTQRLSHPLGAVDGENGVCANVRFPSPAALVAEAVAATSDTVPDDDPWDRGRLLWSLLEVLDDAGHEPWAAALASRRLTPAQHLAALFDSYAAHRPAMLETGPTVTTPTAPAAGSAPTSPGRRSSGGAARTDRYAEPG